MWYDWDIMAKKLFTIHIPNEMPLITSYLTSKETNIGYIFPVGIINNFSYNEYEVVEISSDKSELWVEEIKCIPDF